MEKRKVSARLILQDIRGGLLDSEIMEKHQMSERSLDHVLVRLVQAGTLTDAEFAMREAILNKVLFRDVKEGLSDIEIMEKHQVSEHHLRATLDRLVRRGSMSEAQSA